nr:unnamed protein product [uncultured bacterium]
MLKAQYLIIKDPFFSGGIYPSVCLTFVSFRLVSSGANNSRSMGFVFIKVISFSSGLYFFSLSFFAFVFSAGSSI